MTWLHSYFRLIWPPLPVWRGLDLGVFAIAIYTLIVEIAADIWDFYLPDLIGQLGIFNGILLGVLLGFRNKEAYDRWWEARKLWGQLINDSRNYAIKVKAFAALGTAECRQAGTAVYHFALAMKYHLRGRKHGSQRPEFAPADLLHLPAHQAGVCIKLLHDWKDQGKLSDIEFLALDPHGRGLMDVCGACERIQSTPVPLSYRSLLRHGTIIFLATAPWFIASQHGYWGIAIVPLFAYFLLGTELTAESIEDPFGHGGDDLELGRYCETIRVSMQEILEIELPAPARTIM